MLLPPVVFSCSVELAGVRWIKPPNDHGGLSRTFVGGEAGFVSGDITTQISLGLCCEQLTAHS
ncbi:MAG: hypothetical protein B5766_04635 [Candidatus Lumbricidophila eiseniae]|uniref:Uncharacterized protein n=1 Tax=Candidatus Lumbricidiphila eiseniae TaxID=1969409 RepID=A0A2A6FS83_9MICO|nr:MAG: hypothetical protein B5766_04635 [Candidatus Lumbricidophila eiseniae]